MKLNIQQIIGGKSYDTKTATLVGCVYRGRNRIDFSWLREGLFKSPSGQFFLAGMGGACSQWAKRVDNGRVEGEGVKLFTEKEALEWAEENEVPTSIIEQHFTVTLG